MRDCPKIREREATILQAPALPKFLEKANDPMPQLRVVDAHDTSHWHWGEWRKRENHHQYRATTGAVLNWWKSTGTIMFKGPRPAAKDLEAAFLRVPAIIEEEPTGWIRC